MGRVVDGIVRYLQPKEVARPEPDGTAQRGSPDGPSRYYADSGEEPGRWLGRAADRAGLRGEVQRGDFAAVLSGRDPLTGERLISAQGSAGRRGHLGAGTATRTAPDGTRLYDEADAATVLGATKAEAARMFDVGSAVGGIVPEPGAEDGPALGRAEGPATGRESSGRSERRTSCRSSAVMGVAG